MRDAFHEIRILRADDKRQPPFGISLGYDYCAEHEYGTENLKFSFGVDPDAGPGIACRQTKALDDRVAAGLLIKPYKATKTMRAETRLVFHPYVDEAQKYLKHRNSEPYQIRKGLDRIETAWDDRSFMIRAFTDEDRLFLTDLHAALLHGDAAIGHAPAAPFGGAGLTMTIVSRMPQDLLINIKAADIDHDAMIDAAKKTGIEEALREAGKKWFALKPRWANTMEQKRTRHPVMFWLNPMDQRTYSWGWYSVEDLELWALGKGPVIEKAKEKT